MKLAVALAAASLGIAFGASASQASAPAPIVFAADRAPTVTGEIYRVDPNGHRVDLSNSPFQDEDPAVSADGKHVAFLSDRLGGTSVYEVGIDGRNVSLVARRLYRQLPYGEIYWQPHGDRLAVDTTRVSIVRPFHQPIVAPGHAFATSTSPWSADGKVLAVWTGKRVRGVNARGRVLWTVKATGPLFGSPSGAWSSSTGLLALQVSAGVVVYDERGHLRQSFPRASSFSWSPNGRLLALALPRSTVVVTARGTRVLRTRNGFGPWIDNRHLGFYTRHPNKCGFLNVRTGAVRRGGCGNWLETPRSADGKLAIVTPPKGEGFTLGAAPARGGAVKAYTHVPGCSTGNGGVEWTPAPGSLQFAGRTRSIVYENWGSCDSAPAADLYEVEPDGSGLKRLTHLTYGSGAMAPRVSPDGSEIAYVSYDADPGMCGQSVETATSSGGQVRDVSDWDYFGAPAWSPDGKTLLDSGMSCGGDPHDSQLFTIPAGGGSPKYLNVRGTEVAWGPTRIAFVGDKGLTTADPSGANRVVVAKKGRDPAWSTSGELAYVLGTSLVVGNNAPVSLPLVDVQSLEWTADGTQLVFAASTTKGDDLDLYAINPNGTGLVQLTTNFGVFGDPSYPFP